MIPVEGIITLEGTPLVAAEVMFDSADGPRGFGTTDESGRFTVMTRQFGAGLPVGTYRVMIAGSERTRVAPSGKPVKLSPRYRESGVGKATIAVGGGPLQFDLKKSAGAGSDESGDTAEP
ncbi:MAG: carboxypeptidase-like regulatory domain-containing protein [Planctomycetaceae bacterium]